MPRLTSYRIEKSWRTQARVPAGVPTGGEWTHGGGYGHAGTPGSVVPLSGVAGLSKEQRMADALGGSPQDYKVVAEDPKTNVTILEATGPAGHPELPDYGDRVFKEFTEDDTAAAAEFHQSTLGSYSDHGHATTNVSHADVWLGGKALSGDEQDSIEHYTSSGYKHINKFIFGKRLRRPEQFQNDPEAQTYADYTRHLDSVLARSTVPQDVIVHRGLSNSAWKFIEPHVAEGQTTILDHGFISTSTRAKIAQGAFGEGTLVQIRLPKGAKGLSVQRFSSHSHEHEVLLPRNTKIVIRKVTAERPEDPSSIGTFVNQRIIYADVIP